MISEYVLICSTSSFKRYAMSFFNILISSVGSAYIKSTFMLSNPYCLHRLIFSIICFLSCFLFRSFKLYLLKLSTPILSLLTLCFFSVISFSSVISLTLHSKVISAFSFNLNTFNILNNLSIYSSFNADGVPPPIYNVFTLSPS